MLQAGLTVTPSRVEVAAPPGGRFEGKYTVRNDYNTPAKIKVEFRDWFVLPENSGINISDWLSVSPLEFSLQPNESREVQYAVHLSTSARGVQVGMVSFIPQTGEEQGVTLMVSVSIFVTAKGTERIDWEIPDVKLAKASGKLQVTALVKNDGNVHLRPSGSVTILSGGKIAAQLDFLESRPVYPGLSRSILARSDGDAALLAGKYTALIDIKCYGQEKTKKINFNVKQSGELAIE